MKDYLRILFATIRLDWRILRARPVLPVVQPHSSNRFGERTRTTSRVAWN